jgi:hypothetical protein
VIRGKAVTSLNVELGIEKSFEEEMKNLKTFYKNCLLCRIASREE